MNKNKQNKAIAILAGWQYVDEKVMVGITKEGADEYVPQYTDSLDAIREAKKETVDKDRKRMTSFCLSIVRQAGCSIYKLINASSEVQARALLEAYNLWEDE